jgi:hypothetical protein
MNLTKIAKYYSDPEAARTFLEKQGASSGFRVCGRLLGERSWRRGLVIGSRTSTKTGLLAITAGSFLIGAIGANHC